MREKKVVKSLAEVSLPTPATPTVAQPVAQTVQPPAKQPSKIIIPTFHSPDLKGLGGNVEKMKEEMSKITSGVTEAITFIRSAYAQLASYAEDKLGLKLARASVGAGVEQAKTYLDERLTCDVEIGGIPIPKQVAAVAYIQAVLGVEVKDNDEEVAFTAMRDLQDRGIVVPKADSDKEYIMIGYQGYKVSDKWGFDEADKADITASLKKFADGIRIVRKHKREKQVASMESRANVTLTEVEAKADGLCLLKVRPEPRFDKETGEPLLDRATGKQLYHPGGKLLVEFRGNSVSPVCGSGAIDRVVEDMLRLRVWIPYSTLSMERFSLDRREGRDYFLLALRLWTLVTNGIDGYHAEEAQKNAVEKLTEHAEISALEFFGLNGAAGIPVNGKLALLKADGVYQHKGRGPKYFDPCFLVKGEGEGEERLFELVAIPPSLKELLGEYIGKKFSVGNNFGACLFGNLMRFIKNQHMHAATLSETLAEQTSEPVPAQASEPVTA